MTTTRRTRVAKRANRKAGHKHQSERDYACPTCGTTLTRARYEEVLAITDAKERELARLKKVVDKERAKLDKAREGIEAEVRKKTQAAVRKERAKLGKARAEIEAEARKKAQVVARKEQDKRVRTLETQLKSLERERHKESARNDTENMRLQKEVKKLQAKLQGRKRVHFGPEGETDLCSALKVAFPADDIERKGRGGDVLHRVLEKGIEQGLIVYEVKNTSSWQTAYLRQLRRDMRRHGTRHGVLVTRTFPAGESSLCVRDGLVVVAPPLARYVATVLREAIVRLAAARFSAKDRDAKAEQLVDYLGGDDFGRAIKAVHKRVDALRKDLDQEKATHDRWWQGRTEAYSDIAFQAAGIYKRVDEILSAAGEEGPSKAEDVETAMASSSVVRLIG